MTPAGEPEGGQFSFDEDNRRKVPKTQAVPALPDCPPDTQVAATADLVARLFPDHPGAGRDLWLPVTRAGALRWLRCFLEERFAGFGT